MYYYDAHTHLNDDRMFPEWEIYLNNFINIGGKGLINVGTSLVTSERAVDISNMTKEKYKDIFVSACVGLHPLEVCERGESALQDISFIKELYLSNKSYVVAWGECGLDYHYDVNLHKDVQKNAFAMQCDLAVELNLPIVIHSRDAWKDTWDIIKNYKDHKIYFHCWGYGADEIKLARSVLNNLWVGFCGNITYPKSDYLRDALIAMDGGNILMETDAPYLSPQSKRGKTNESANLLEIYEYCAKLIGRDLDVFCKEVEGSFDLIYGLPSVVVNSK